MYQPLLGRFFTLWSFMNIFNLFLGAADRTIEFWIKVHMDFYCDHKMSNSKFLMIVLVEIRISECFIQLDVFFITTQPINFLLYSFQNKFFMLSDSLKVNMLLILESCKKTTFREKNKTKLSLSGSENPQIEARGGGMLRWEWHYVCVTVELVSSMYSTLKVSKKE